MGCSLWRRLKWCQFRGSNSRISIGKVATAVALELQQRAGRRFLASSGSLEIAGGSRSVHGDMMGSLDLEKEQLQRQQLQHQHGWQSRWISGWPIKLQVCLCCWVWDRKRLEE